MNTLVHPIENFAATLPDWRRPLNFVLYNIVGWTCLSAFIALAVYTDDYRSGGHPQYGSLFFNWFAAAMALAPLSWTLYYCFERWDEYFSRVSFILMTYLMSLFFILPWHIFDAAMTMIWAAPEHRFLDRVLAYEDVICLFRLCAITIVYGAVLGLRLWHLNRDRLQALRDEREQSLQLNLALERQNVAILRAQLEPHFMFNSLNSVSALVRTERNEKALVAIEKLSELLRYSLSSNERRCVSVDEELQGLEDYISLQKLRYGERLVIKIEGVTEPVRSCYCPPFFLQPLLENAIKHDVDAHQGISDIVIQFEMCGREHQSILKCTVSNPLHHQQSSPRGFGLGLKTLGARLESLYGEKTLLHTYTEAGRFFVEVGLPNDE